MNEITEYRGFKIYYDPPPIPHRGFDYAAVHYDMYDAWNDGDGWQDNGLAAYGATLEECKKAVDELYEEHDLLHEAGA